MNAQLFFALASIAITFIAIFFYAGKKGLLQKVVIKKFATYSEALKFLEEKVKGKKAVWKKTLDILDYLTLVEIQKENSFGDVAERWILTKPKNKTQWLVTNDRFFIQRKMDNHYFNVHVKTTSPLARMFKLIDD